LLSCTVGQIFAYIRLDSSYDALANNFLLNLLNRYGPVLEARARARINKLNDIRDRVNKYYLRLEKKRLREEQGQVDVLEDIEFKLVEEQMFSYGASEEAGEIVINEKVDQSVDFPELSRQIQEEGIPGSKFWIEGRNLKNTNRYWGHLSESNYSLPKLSLSFGVSGDSTNLIDVVPGNLAGKLPTIQIKLPEDSTKNIRFKYETPKKATKVQLPDTVEHQDVQEEDVSRDYGLPQEDSFNTDEDPIGKVLNETYYSEHSEVSDNDLDEDERIFSHLKDISNLYKSTSTNIQQFSTNLNEVTGEVSTKIDTISLPGKISIDVNPNDQVTTNILEVKSSSDTIKFPIFNSKVDYKQQHLLMSPDDTGYAWGVLNSRFARLRELFPNDSVALLTQKWCFMSLHKLNDWV